MLKSKLPRATLSSVITIMQRAGRLIGKLKLSPSLLDPEARAKAAWKIAAGKKIAEHTRPTVLVRDTLIVEVEDLVWQRQLNTLRHFLLRNLTALLGEEMIKEIDFRPAPKRRPVQSAQLAKKPSAESEIGIADPIMAILYQNSKKGAA